MLHHREAEQGAWPALEQDIFEVHGVGVGYSTMRTAKAGDAMEMICPSCLTLRNLEKLRCLFCKSAEEAVHCTRPAASMRVYGILWELGFDSARDQASRRSRNRLPVWM